jgi:S-adenosyl methyltransferase
MGDDLSLPRVIDTSVAHPARRYDYWLGGSSNFQADRESGDAVAAAFPTVRTAAVENRRFLGRAARFLAGEAGIHQFLDVGTGIPTANNTHEVVQRLNPAARVVYVDNDPIVLAHARALLAGTHQDGVTAYIDGDLRDPDTILGDPALAATLDLSRPVALMLVAVLHFVLDQYRPYDLVHRMVEALAPGSYLVLSHATNDFMPPQTAADVNDADTRTRVDFQFRGHDQVARFFRGHELVSPGLVSVAEWRAENEVPPRPSAAQTAVYGGVARIHAAPH